MAQLVYKDTGHPDTQEYLTTEMSVGEILRRSRMHYNLSLYDVERELHIKPPQIQAMESDDFERLPGRVYAIGFIRSYAEFLGLDGDKMIRLYKIQARGRSANPKLQYPATASESKLPGLWIVGVSILAAITLAVFWGAGQSSNITSTETPSQIPDVPEHLRVEPSAGVMIDEAPAEPQNLTKSFANQDNNTLQSSRTDYEEYSSKIIPSAEAPPAEDGLYSPIPDENPAPSQPAVTVKSGLVLTVKETTNIEIKGADTNVLASKTLQPGEQYFIPDRKGLTLSLDNASAIALEIDGTDIGPLGEPGKPLRDFSLEVDYLKSRLSLNALKKQQPENRP